MRTDDEMFLRSTYTLRQLVGDKWTPAILIALTDGPRRPSEILATVNTFSTGREEWPERQFTLHDSILARALRRLTDAQLVAREEAGDTFPPRVLYELTDLAREYLALERTIAEWAARNVEQMRATERTRVRHDGDSGTVGPLGELDQAG